MDIKRSGSRPSGKGPVDWMEKVSDAQYEDKAWARRRQS
jgi:hypothetical protein